MHQEKHTQEEEYFHREDQEKIQKLREELARQRAHEARAALQSLHRMHCGKCGEMMIARVFKGVTIDCCPTCRAVLLTQDQLELLAGKDQSDIIRTITDFFHFSRQRI